MKWPHLCFRVFYVDVSAHVDAVFNDWSAFALVFIHFVFVATETHLLQWSEAATVLQSHHVTSEVWVIKLDQLAFENFENAGKSVHSSQMEHSVFVGIRVLE